MADTTTGSQESNRDDDGLAVRLLYRIARGDRGAMDHFYGLHESGVYRLALGVVDDAQGATRVLVNVMLAVWRDAANLAAEGNVRTALRSLGLREARAWAATRGSGNLDAAPAPTAEEPEPKVHLDHTPGDFGLDQLWSALDTEHRAQRRARLRRRVLRWVVTVKRSVAGLVEVRRAA